MQHWVLTVALWTIPATLGTAYTAHAAEAAHAAEVSITEMKTTVAARSATIIDANGGDMYKNGHIPGAISFEKNSANLAAVLPKDKAAPIIAYCGGPLCSAWEDAAKSVQALGYTNVKHFTPGIKGWKDAGQATEKGT